MAFSIILILLIILEGYFSAVEISLVSLKKFKVQEAADKGSQPAQQVLGILKDPGEYLSAIQVGTTLVGLIEGLYGGEVLEAYLQPVLIRWGLPTGARHLLGTFLGIGCITYLTIVTGELIPKSIAIQRPQATAFLLAPSFRVFTRIAYPFVKLLTASTHFLLRLFHFPQTGTPALTEADLRSLLTLAYRQGTLEKNKWLLHENIFTFNERTVQELMTPFEQLVIMETGMSPMLVEQIIRGSKHQYFPVLEAPMTIAGCLSAKDFLLDPGQPLATLLRPACTIQPQQTAAELLKEFKRTQQNFGMVINTLGELQGVVTMHDIGEHFIGEIP